MKAYVIKNKEGKYWYGYDLLVNKNLFTIKISNAVLNNPTKKNCLDAIKEYSLKDCQVVEITIAEVDNSKKEYNETIKYVETTEPDKVAEYIDDLQKQLAEKDKEIADLNAFHDLYIDPKEYCLEGLKKQIRHQICDEIREKLELHCEYIEAEHFVGWYLNESKIGVLIDQIEKGETK